jgi:hypothetical protein
MFALMHLRTFSAIGWRDMRVFPVAPQELARIGLALGLC